MIRILSTVNEALVGEDVTFIDGVINNGASDLVGVRVVSNTITTADGAAVLLGVRAPAGVFDPTTATRFTDRVASGEQAALECFTRTRPSAPPNSFSSLQRMCPPARP